jgi:tetratricopeptide (TPR) repeat protein
VISVLYFHYATPMSGYFSFLKSFTRYGTIIQVTLFSCLTLIVRAQDQSTIDSLSSLLKTDAHDTIKVDVYLLLSKKLENDSVQSLRYIRSAVDLSQSTGDHRRSCKSFLALARYHDKYDNLPALREALSHAKEHLKFFQDPAVESTLYYRLGAAHYFSGEYKDAVDNFWAAVRLYEGLNDTIWMAASYLNLGNCNRELGHDDKATEFYLNALSLYEKKGYEAGAGMAYGNLGNIYKGMRRFDQAFSYYKKSLLISKKSSEREHESIDLNNIGDLYLIQEEYDSANAFFKNSYDVAKAASYPRGMLLSRFNMAVVEYKLKNYSSAIQTFKQVLKEAQIVGQKDMVRDAYKLLSIAYSDMGQFQQALTHRIEFEKWKDSVVNEQYLNEVKELEIRYETEKKDQQIQLLAKEKEVQQKEVQRQSTLKKAFIVGFVLVVLLVALVTYTFSHRLKTQKLLTEKNNEIKEISFKHQVRELEMKALRAQINPHFFFNCMNSINKMILNNEVDCASLYLTKFSKLVRLVLENSESTHVSLENELMLVESYIELEALRFKEKIGYTISVDESIEKESTYLPAMVLQPFVENAIWHGLMHKEDGERGIININIKEADDKLHCTIEDNGVGRVAAQKLNEKAVLKSRSLGIKITEERLRLLTKERLDKLIQITDLKDSFDQALGTRVEVNIPIVQ